MGEDVYHVPIVVHWQECGGGGGWELSFIREHSLSLLRSVSVFSVSGGKKEDEVFLTPQLRHQGGALQPQHLCRRSFVAIGKPQCLVDQAVLKLLHGLLQVDLSVAESRVWQLFLRDKRADVNRQVLWADDILVAEDHQLLDQMFQLPDVARPIVLP